MRRATLGLGLSLSLVLSASAPAQQPLAGAGTGRIAVPAGTFTAKEARQLPQRLPVDARGLVLDQNGNVLSATPPGCLPCETSGSLTGVAYVGLGANGDAMYIGSAEPAPIGVMRTNYAGAALSAMPPASAPGLAGVGNPALGNALQPSVPPLDFAPTKRPSVVSRMLGMPRLGGWGEARRERRMSQHAAIRYDQMPANPGSLPASMVYGR